MCLRFMGILLDQLRAKEKKCLVENRKWIELSVSEGIFKDVKNLFSNKIPKTHLILLLSLFFTNIT